MAPDAEEVAVLRVVIREGLSRDMAELLAGDIHRTVDHLDKVYEGSTKETHHKKRAKKKTKAVC